MSLSNGTEETEPEGKVAVPPPGSVTKQEAEGAITTSFKPALTSAAAPATPSIQTRLPDWTARSPEEELTEKKV